MARRLLAAAGAPAAGLWLAGCAALPPGAECRSLLGAPLFAPELEPAVRSEREAALAAAAAALAAAPDDRDAAIWVARRLGYLGRYRQAIAVLTTALARHPGDPFLLRHRGHRWLSVREFDRARTDLAAAAWACRTVPDVVEPDGLPTPGRPPHSTLHFNVHYHLGLAEFLRGDHRRAERSWLDCLAVSHSDEARVAVLHWLWSVRMRLGDPAGAAAAVAAVTPAMDVVENRSYLELCLFYAGRLDRTALAASSGPGDAARRFGLAHYDLVCGNRVAAQAALAALAREQGWAAFGVIAAEAESARW